MKLLKHHYLRDEVFIYYFLLGDIYIFLLFSAKVNLSNLTENDNPFEINILTLLNKQRKRLSTIFPDEDFCMYRDFPFDQFIIISEFIYFQFNFELNNFNKERKNL